MDRHSRFLRRSNANEIRVDVDRNKVIESENDADDENSPEAQQLTDRRKSQEPSSDTLYDAYMEVRNENKLLMSELARLQEEVKYLREKLADRSFGQQFIARKEKNARTKFFTGVPNYNAFLWLVTYLSSALPQSSTLSPGDVLLLILMKLRLNLKMQDLGYRFGISVSRVSQIIQAGLPQIAEKLLFLVRWPDREEIIRTLPNVFKSSYRFKKCRVIIDCTEIFIERGRNLNLRALTWSNYKHHNTLKILVGITPTGSISFVSKAFGGRISDKVITNKSGFLNLLENGDLVLADRGFLISEELAAHGASLAIPAFTRGKKQLSCLEVESTRRLARIRIHVERAMERIKNFTILSTILPIALVAQADNIIMICAALSNLQPKLVS